MGRGADMAAGKKKLEDKNTGTLGSTRSLRDNAEKQLASLQKRSPDLKGQTPEQLIHELQVHQIELEMQAEELRKSHLALEKSRDKFFDLYDFAPTGILTLSEKGLIVEVNLTGSTLLGVERCKLVRIRFSTFVAPEDRDQWYLYITNLLRQEEKQCCTLLLKLTDGSAFPARLEGVRLWNGGIHNEVRIAFSDITDLKKAEETLRQSERRYRAISETTTDFIFSCIKPEGGTYTIDWMAGAFEQITGYSIEEMLAMGCWRCLVHPDDTAVFDENIINLPAGTSKTCMLRIRTKSGTIRWLDVHTTHEPTKDSSSFSHIFGGCKDITDNKLAEETLRESEERHRTILQTTNDGFWIIDLPEGNLTDVNKTYCRMSGYTRAELLKMRIPDLDAIKTPDEQAATIKKIITNGSGIFETRHHRKDGSVFDVELSVTYQNTHGGRLICFCRDITERKKMEYEIQSMNRDLEQRVIERTSQLNASLEDKTVLLQEVHHRVKNNLQIIISLLNLQSRYMKDETTLAAFRDTKNRIHAMALVHEKLYRSTDLTKLDLSNYIKFLWEHVLHLFGIKGKGIKFKMDIQDIFLPIDTAISLGLIINELISNSLKYAFPNGRKGEISLTGQRQDHTLTILFKDNGVGIPEDFDWRNAESLGLRLVVSLVDQLDGTIELDRSAGTAFTIVVKEKE